MKTYQNIVTPYYFVREYLMRVNQKGGGGGGGGGASAVARAEIDNVF